MVTGAARGLGAAIAERLAAAGLTVAVADLSPEGAATQAARIEELGGRAFGLRVDVAERASARAMVDAVIARTGRLDVLVNNAGIVGSATAVVDLDPAEWRRVMAIDLDGVFHCTQAALPHLVGRGWGRIVNVASIAGKEGNALQAPYSTAKAGVIAFTKALGKELATTGVLVNAVAPAAVESDIWQQLTPELKSSLVARIPMGRAGQPREVAALVAWLCSDECSFSTGAVFDISGGRATY